MKSNGLLRYRGYFAKPKYSAEDRIFYGEILGISNLVDFQFEEADDIENEFHKAVDDYLQYCMENGKCPEI